MSTFSPSLRIELITTGTQAGTWGNTTNTNLGGLIESAIAGYTSVSVISADQALTALNGAPDESRNQTIALTTTTTAAFNVYAPPAEKTYVIYNASAYAATIYNSTVMGNTTAAGLGVTIPAGRTGTVWSDGANFSFQNDHLASLTLASPLAATSGGTGLTGLGAGVATFLGTPSSANLAAAVTGETGSGALVFATSPTLVTPALGTPSSVVLTNATGLPNAGLVNSAITINGNSVSLGGSTTVTATATNALTIGTGLSGTSYNGSSAVTVAIDSTVATLSGTQTLTNKTLVTPALGTPASGVMTNVTGLPLTTGVTGTLPVANGGTGVTSSTGTGSVVLSASPTFTGTPAAPTASVSTNTTQLATTAFVQAALQTLYPVGSIYTNATNSTNPGTLLGFGTWTAFAAGRVAVGFNASNALFDTAEETGGSADSTLPSHTHTGTTAAGGSASGTLNSGFLSDFGNFTAASGVFSLSESYANRSQGAGGTGSSGLATLTIPTHTHTITTDSSGSSGTNANYQPYITVYMWKRTA
jgi:hypothetical protein